MIHLEDLLKQCTVKLIIPYQHTFGTGFFVAPRLILTCAHVVKNVEQLVQVRWQDKETWANAVVEQFINEMLGMNLCAQIEQIPGCLHVVQVSVEVGEEDGHLTSGQKKISDF